MNNTPLCVCPFVHCWISTLLLYLGYCKICYSLHGDAYIIVCDKLLLSCPTLCFHMDCSPSKAPLSVGFSRQEYWNALSYPRPGHRPNPGIQPVFQVGSLPLVPPTKPMQHWIQIFFAFRKYIELELLDHMIVLFLIFGGTSTLFSVVAVPIYIPTNITQRSLFFFSNASQQLLFVVFLIRAFLTDSFLTGSFLGGSVGKKSDCNAGYPDLIPGLGRSLRKRMAIHSSILAWRIPWTEGPGRL